MKEFSYIKTWNSQKNVDNMWQKLTIGQKNKLNKMLLKLEKDLDLFKDNSSVAYSLLLHILTHKIDLIEQEITVKQIVPIHKTPFEKEEIDPTVIGEIKW